MPLLPPTYASCFPLFGVFFGGSVGARRFYYSTYYGETLGTDNGLGADGHICWHVGWANGRK